MNPNPTAPLQPATEAKPPATPGTTPLAHSRELILSKMTTSRTWFMDGPNWYRNVRKELERVLNMAQSPVTFELRAVTDYGGEVWVHFGDRLGGTWKQLTKGKLRWNDLGFYGLHPR